MTDVSQGIGLIYYYLDVQSATKLSTQLNCQKYVHTILMSIQQERVSIINGALTVSVSLLLTVYAVPK